MICGNNGQGKTNLLEAIWLLTGGKSFRGGKDAELVRRGETFVVLEPSPSAPGRRIRNRTNRQMCALRWARRMHSAPAGMHRSTALRPSGRRALRAAFRLWCSTPGHLSLVKGAPEGRRRFLDAALCQLYPGYLATYRRYVRALQQKNALLRHSAGGTERPWAENAPCWKC